MRRVAALILFVCGLSGCAQTEQAADGPHAETRLLGNGGLAGMSGRPARVGNATFGEQRSKPSAYFQIGDGGGSIQAPGQRPIGIEPGGKKMTLQFVNADIQDFVRSVFDEILREPVVMDPNVTGRVTVRTGEAVDRAAAVEIVRQMLEMNGAQLSRDGGVWRIKAQPAGGGRIGGATRIITLRNADMDEARTALTAFSNGAVTVTPLPGGRSLMLSGPPQEVEPLAQLADSIDIDKMRGQSFALLPLREAGAAAVARELGQVFGAAGKNFQAIPVARMNAVLVIAANAGQIRRARDWVAQLDKGGQDDGRIFVYPVQNRRAVDLAAVLRQMFGGQGDSTQKGQTPAEGSPVSPGFASQTAGTAAPDAGQPPAGQSPMGAANPQQTLEAAFAGTNGGGAGAAAPGPGKVAIQADTATNSLVVTATAQQWRTISAAIGRLDVQPTQVLIEATIAEVQLNKELRHGVRWFFETGNHSFTLSDLETGAVSPSFPGGSYSFSVPSARVVLSALEKMTDVEVVSSPALTVLDNQTATLKVGDQVPIATRSSRSVTNPDSPVVNDIELKDTGVILSVTPRVNASGLVQLDISQEVSDVVATTTSTIDSPTIRQRKVDSSVAIASGAEIVLGGMIGQRRETGDSGLPLLKDIPLLGNAFKSSAGGVNTRSELLIILRPTVMGSRNDVEAVTQAVRARMSGAGRAIYR